MLLKYLKTGNEIELASPSNKNWYHLLQKGVGGVRINLGYNKE